MNLVICPSNIYTIVNLDSHIGNKFPIIVNLDSYFCFVKSKIILKKYVIEKIDTENAIFEPDDESGDFVLGFTTPWEMKGWTFEILGYDKAEYESLYCYGEFEAMRRAQRIRSGGGVAFPMIHTAMLGGS